MITTLRQRNFALLWFGGLISSIGDWILNIGLPIYVFLLTHSILATSIMLFAGYLPSVLFGSIAGVLVDRWNHRNTMIITSLLLMLALLPLLVVRTEGLIWIVYVVAFIEASISQFFMPAQNALLPMLVIEEHLVYANALNSFSGNAARLIGPALGGIIAALFGLSGIVLADVFSFLISGALIFCISISPIQDRLRFDRETLLPVTKLGVVSRALSEWIDGLHVIRSERTLIVLLGAFALIGLGEGAMGTLFPIFVYQVLHGTALQIGELMSAQAVGGIAGGLLVGWIGKRVTTGWVIGLCTVIFGLIDLAIFNTPTFFPVFWLSFGLFVLVGIPGIIGQTGMFSLMQAKAPDNYRGRVFGALNTTLGLLILIGTLITGAVTEHLGVVTILNLQGTGYIAAGLLMTILLPREQKLGA